MTVMVLKIGDNKNLKYFILIKKSYLNFRTSNEVEAYARGTPWWDLLIDDVIIFVMWLMYILQTSNHFCWCQHNPINLNKYDTSN